MLIKYYYHTKFANNEERDNTDPFPIRPILGSELEGFEYTQYPLLTSPIELSAGTQFHFWILLSII